MDLRQLAKAYDTRIDAILGLDVLRRQSFTIDYRRRQLRFGEHHPFGRLVSLDPGYHLAVIARVNGKPSRLLVDTGADNLAVFADRLPRELQRRTRVPARSTSVAGTRKAALLGAVEVELGDARLRNAPIYALMADKGVSGYDGHLGVAVLDSGWIFFDFENGKLWWGR